MCQILKDRRLQATREMNSRGMKGLLLRWFYETENPSLIRINWETDHPDYAITRISEAKRSPRTQRKTYKTQINGNLMIQIMLMKINK